MGYVGSPLSCFIESAHMDHTNLQLTHFQLVGFRCTMVLSMIKQNYHEGASEENMTTYCPH